MNRMWRRWRSVTFEVSLGRRYSVHLALLLRASTLGPLGPEASLCLPSITSWFSCPLVKWPHWTISGGDKGQIMIPWKDNYRHDSCWHRYLLFLLFNIFLFFSPKHPHFLWGACLSPYHAVLLGLLITCGILTSVVPRIDMWLRLANHSCSSLWLQWLAMEWAHDPNRAPGVSSWKFIWAKGNGKDVRMDGAVYLTHTFLSSSHMKKNHFSGEKIKKVNLEEGSTTKIWAGREREILQVPEDSE